MRSTRPTDPADAPPATSIRQQGVSIFRGLSRFTALRADASARRVASARRIPRPQFRTFFA
jgi:hypothetical protein